MVKERLPKHISKWKLKNIKKFIQDALFNLKEEQFGYDCFELWKLSPNPMVYFDF